MSSLPDYTLRYIQYLDLMLLFGLPLFAWYGPASSTTSGDKQTPLSRCALTLALLIFGVLGLALAGIEFVRSTAGIMGVVVSDLARDDLAWYLFDTPAGRAGRRSEERRVGKECGARWARKEGS